MAASSAQEPSEWDEDPAWSRPDPMTAAELEACAGPGLRAGRGPPRGRGGRVRGLRAASPRRSWPEIREAAADELLAVEAATTGRRGPGPARLRAGLPRRVVQPGGRVRARDGRWTCCPAARGLAVAADAAAGEDGRFAGVSEAELIGVLCAWDRVEAHAAARKLAVVGGAGPPQPRARGRRSSPRTRWPTRWASPAAAPRALLDLAQTLADPAARHRRGAGRRDDLPVQGRDHRPRHRAAR